MQTKPILFIFLLLIVISSSNCSSSQKTAPVNDRCNNDIEQVSKLLKEKSGSLNKADSQRIQNLIKAAKIQQQHGRFNTCVDKMNRALTLMKEDPASKQVPKVSN